MQKLISTKQTYESGIFTITKDEVEINGGIYPRDVIHHHGGVGVLAIQDDKILLVKQFRHAIRKDTLEIPAGKLELNEDPYTCGLRELEEESGYTSDKLESVCMMYSTPGFCNERIFIYWSDQLHKVAFPKAMDEDEDIEIVWLSIQEAYDLITNGGIQDAKTIIAVQFAYLRYLNSSINQSK